MPKFTAHKIPESRKSTTEMKHLIMGDGKAETTKQEKTSEGLDRYIESKNPALCMTSDVEKLEWLCASESSPASGVSLTVEMGCLDKDDRKVEKTKQDDLFGSEESE